MYCKNLLVSLLLLSLIGCVHTYAVKRQTVAHSQLDPKGYAYIVTPHNGSFGGREYYGSGKDTAQALLSAFSEHLINVVASGNYQATDEALEKAKNLNFTYLVSSTIMHWEDRATEWSGRPDRIKIKIVVIDVESKNIVDSTTISGKSRWLTFGGDHPHDLLSEPIQKYVASLF